MHLSLKLLALCLLLLLLLLPLGADACEAGRSYHSGYAHCNRNGHYCRWSRPHHHHHLDEYEQEGGNHRT